jgi:hypothetical protein
MSTNTVSMVLVSVAMGSGLSRETKGTLQAESMSNRIGGRGSSYGYAVDETGSMSRSGSIQNSLPL